MPVAYVDVTGIEGLAAASGKSVQTVEQIAQQTVNRGIDRGKTRAAKGYAAEVQTLQAPYRYALSKFRTTKASVQNGISEATLSAEKKGLLLSRYANRPGANGGVDVRVGANSGYKNIIYGFKLRAKNGTDIIAFRRPGARRYNTLYGPSPSQVFETQMPEIAAELDAWTAAEVTRRLKLDVVPLLDRKPG